MVRLDQPTELQQISHEAAPSSADPGVSIALRNILVPTDLSDRAKKAVNYAVALAEHFGAKLTLLYVDTTPYLEAYFGGSNAYPVLRRYCAHNLETFDELGRQIRGRYANSQTCFRCGNFCEEIVHVAIALDADLIVLCTHDYEWINRLSKSDAEDVLRRAPCPVLIVHDHEHDFVPSEV
jgi:nucleotide-binding universal stress UspA family protein